MAKRTLTADELNTYFMQMHRKMGTKLFDQTIEKSTVLAALQGLGKFTTYTQPSDLRFRVKHEVHQGQAYSERGKVEVTNIDPQTEVEWKGKHLAWSGISYFHDRINTGADRVYELWDELKKSIFEDAPKLIENQILSSNAPSDIGVEGFGYVLSNSNTTGSPGGIDRSVASNDYWKHHVLDMDGENFSVSGERAILQMYQKCREDGTKGPNLIFTEENIYNQLEMQNIARSIMVKPSGKVTVGFEALEYKGAIIVQSPKIATGRMLFLTTDDFEIKTHAGDNMFKHTPQEHPQHPGDTIHVFTQTTNIVWHKLRRCGVIFNMTVESLDIN